MLLRTCEAFPNDQKFVIQLLRKIPVEAFCPMTNGPRVVRGIDEVGNDAISCLVTESKLRELGMKALG